MTERAQHQIETAHVRRSPRYAIFFVLGAILGILAALILTFAFDGTEEKSASTQVSQVSVMNSSRSPSVRFGRMSWIFRRRCRGFARSATCSSVS